MRSGPPAGEGTRKEASSDMGAIYIVSTEVHFSSSHALLGYRGDCSRMHGHNWIVRVYYEFSGVDERGLTIDYRELQTVLERVILLRFDHRHLNDIPPFDTVNPTSENIAAEIYRLCREEARIPLGTLREVELWESPADMVRYRED
jgi:6-pyruvoyltetrahydropterin/6-carboxytetrahydropterin synthase